MTEELTIIMELDTPKKHSILFKPLEGAIQPAITGLYIMKTAYKKLGEPSLIKITIARVERE